MIVQIGDKARALEDGYEVPGADEALFRMVPAREHLGAHKPARPVVVLRLEMQLELAVLERVCHLAGELLLLDHRLAQGIVVDGAPIGARFRGAQREQRAISHEAHIQRRVVHPVDADPHEEREIQRVVAQPGVQQPQHAFGIRGALRKAADEVVSAQVGGDAVRRERLLDRGADEGQEPVALLGSVTVVEHLEAVDVAVQHREALGRMRIDKLPHRPVETLSGSEPRQRVAFERTQISAPPPDRACAQARPGRSVRPTRHGVALQP